MLGKFFFVFFRTNKRKKWKTIFLSLSSHSSQLFHSLELVFVCFRNLKSKNINISVQLRYSNVFDIAESKKVVGR